MVQQQAATAGFRVKVSTMDYAALVQTVVTKRAFQVARLTATQTPDPDSMTYIYFYSTSAGNYSVTRTLRLTYCSIKGEVP